jgi:RNA polymerase sigma factor (sigma-70 family)
MKDLIHLITPREKEMLHLLSKGLTYKGIADKTGISPETVKKHLKNIYRKLRVQNKIEALNRVKLL